LRFCRGPVGSDPVTDAASTLRRRVLGLFQQRLAGDDALLELARLRFTQAGLGAEMYADSPDELDRLLAFAPPHARLPVVHLSREVDVLREADRALVATFAVRFAGRISGLVVHDQPDMATRLEDLVGGLAVLGSRLDAVPSGPQVLIEYAAGNELAWFVQLGERLRDIRRVSLCVDVGHIGIRQAFADFARRRPGLSLVDLSPTDPRLPALAIDVEGAVGSALPAVLQLTRSLGEIGKPLHFHLHDGHPVVRGLSDHFSFLSRVAVPFSHEGRMSLDQMYGPLGLSRIVRTAIESCGPDRASFTLEIHQAEGRLPLGDAASLFSHWTDLTNAERTNYWLSVLAQNAILATSAR
jgi:hypothetical protein